MQLRQLLETYFTAVPADIVNCVSDLIPKPVGGNAFTEVRKQKQVSSFFNSIALRNETEYVIAEENGVYAGGAVVLSREFCVHIFVDDNNVVLFHIPRNGEVMNAGTGVLGVPPAFEAWALALLPNNICAIGSLTHLCFMNYVTNTIVPDKIFQLPEPQTCGLYDMLGFRNSNNIVVSYYDQNKIVLLDYETGDVLRSCELGVAYWAVDYTDQLIVQTLLDVIVELHILNPLLECVTRCTFDWCGPFVADRKGFLHVADNKRNNIVVLK